MSGSMTSSSTRSGAASAALLDRRDARCRLGDIVAVLAQHMRFQIATALVVIDNQDVGLGVAHARANSLI